MGLLSRACDFGVEEAARVDGMVVEREIDADEKGVTEGVAAGCLRCTV
jgi:hypothetical protein